MQSNYGRLKQQLAAEKKARREEVRRKRRFDKRPVGKHESAKDNDEFAKLIARVSARKKEARISQSRMLSGLPASIAQYFVDDTAEPAVPVEDAVPVESAPAVAEEGTEEKEKEVVLLPSLVPPSRLSASQRQQWWHDTRVEMRRRVDADLFMAIGTQTAMGRRKHAVTGTPLVADAVAMDCEMVGVGRVDAQKSVLARISLVCEDGRVCYDEFVMGARKLAHVVDFRTDVSGITPEDLATQGMGFDTCMDEVFEVMKGRRVVGHSLSNDWAVLGSLKDRLRCAFYQMHVAGTAAHTCSSSDLDMSAKARAIAKHRLADSDWIWDSASIAPLHGYAGAMPVAKPGRFVRRRALRHLCELFVGIHIQSGEHDSVQDSLSAMLLFKCLRPETGRWQRGRAEEEKGQRDEQERGRRRERRRVVRLDRRRAKRGHFTKAEKRSRAEAEATDDFAGLTATPTFGM